MSTSRFLWLSSLCSILAACDARLTGSEGKVVEQRATEEASVRVLAKFNGSGTLCAEGEGEGRARCKDNGNLFEKIRVLTVPESEAAALVTSLEANENVEWAEIDQKLGAAEDSDTAQFPLPDDLLLWTQSHHGVLRTYPTWHYFAKSSPDVKIVVCDTGISSTHPDLYDSVRPEMCANAVAQREEPCSLTASHGTKVAGIISATGNNGEGVAGITWKSQLIPVQVSSSVRPGSDGVETITATASSLAACIHYAVSIDADIVNISFETMDSTARISHVLKEAAALAEDQGIVVVAAAGNSRFMGSENVASILHVGATDEIGYGPYGYMGGPHVDLAAPGRNVGTTDVILQCFDANGNGSQDPFECAETNNTYAKAGVHGSSYSAPMVTGAVALLKAIRPNLHPVEAACALTSTAADRGAEGRDTLYGNGVLQVDAAAAIVASMEGNARPSMTVSSNRVAIPMNKPLTLTGFATDAEDGNISNTIQWRRPDNTYIQGSRLQIQFPKPGFYRIQASVTDSGCSADVQNIEVVVTNEAPRIVLLNPSSGHLQMDVNSQVVLQASAFDLEEGDISSRIDWSIQLPSGIGLNNHGKGGALVLNLNEVGIWNIRLSVRDSEGLLGGSSIVVVVDGVIRPLAPSNFSAYSPAGLRGTAIISWQDNSDNEEGFVIERAVVNTLWARVGEYKEITRLPANARQYRNDFLPTGTYSFRVRAYNRGGDSQSIEGQVYVK